MSSSTYHSYKSDWACDGYAIVGLALRYARVWCADTPPDPAGLSERFEPRTILQCRKRTDGAQQKELSTLRLK